MARSVRLSPLTQDEVEGQLSLFTARRGEELVSNNNQHPVIQPRKEIKSTGKGKKHGDYSASLQVLLFTFEN
jgi:hypothetical protein